MYGGPVQIAASVPGTGAGSNNGTIAFDGFPTTAKARPDAGQWKLYIAFGSHADAGNYQGWMLAYNASTLQGTAVFNSAPNGRQAAFWHSGRAPCDGWQWKCLAATGNGDWDGVANFGESLLHLSGANLSLLDWYTPQGMEQPQQSGLGSWVGRRDIDSQVRIFCWPAVKRECFIW